MVSISCAALLFQFPFVVCMWVHCDSYQSTPFCSFLGLFVPVHAQDEQIRSTAHRVLPAELLLLEQYHNVILMLQKQLRPSDSLNKGWSPSIYFLRLQIILIIWIPWLQLQWIYLIIHSDQTTKLSKAQAVTLLILYAFHPMNATLQHTFCSWHLWKKGSCAQLYVNLWQR
jgi:hypothetical protein